MKRLYLLLYIVAAFAAVGLSSCFTGIEGTKRVELGREDRRQVIPTAEETYLSDLKGTPLREWRKGRLFIATDDRLQYLLEQNNRTAAASMKGKTLSYEDTETRRLPDGTMQTIVMLRNGNDLYAYRTGMRPERADTALTSDRLPMLIDRLMVERADSMLRGKRLWTRTALWYTGDSTRVTGRKFIPVDVTSVTPGETTFPLRVNFRDDAGTDAFMFMNFGSTGYDSRSFANLFTLDDPRRHYPAISDEHWQLICSCNVALGMTKEECRLALGAPSDVNSGRSYSETLDLWNYSDGKALRFADGVLTSIIMR